MTRPTEVRIERADGTVVPLELAYAGVEDDLHIWEVATVVNLSEYDRVYVGMLPGRTEIRFPVDDYDTHVRTQGGH